MSNISNADKNFNTETKINKNDVVFHNALEDIFEINGVFYENDKFFRIPENVAKSVSEGVHLLNPHTSGGRIRFKTNSPYIAIYAKMGGVSRMPQMTLLGTGGFDLYVQNGEKYVYFNSFTPPSHLTDDCDYESVLDFGATEEKEILINFPLYSYVKELYIGISDKAIIKKPRPYKNSKRIVYYGSSITQGGCASRPGNSYQNMILRKFDCDYINLGFSGNAKAEKEIVDYIANLDMDIFVYDYDHNAPTVEHLKNTHEQMFKSIRDKKPNIPIIMMSRPKIFLNEEEEERFEIVKTTYVNAKNSGDENVYFISGKELMSLTDNDGTVDNCHPNDLGFYSIAETLSKVLEKLM